jgi:putative hydrolase
MRVGQWATATREAPWRWGLKAQAKGAVGVIADNRISALAHPMGMLQRQRGIFPVEAMRTILDAAASCRVAVEISSSYLIDWDGFLGLCGEYDPPVSIGSDAHKVGELGTCRDRLRASGVGTS